MAHYLLRRTSFMAFTEREQKLWRLAMDKSASPGEVRNAAVALISSLRERGVSAYDSKETGNFNGAKPPARPIDNWPGSIIMPWGKHKGKPLAEIDPSYFKWCIENIEYTNRNEDLLSAMEWLLYDILHQQRRTK
jgi:exodeoxyribonuclease X-like protein